MDAPRTDLCGTEDGVCVDPADPWTFTSGEAGSPLDVEAIDLSGLVSRNWRGKRR